MDGNNPTLIFYILLFDFSLKKGRSGKDHVFVTFSNEFSEIQNK